MSIFAMLYSVMRIKYFKTTLNNQAKRLWNRINLDLAISISHQLIEVGGILTGADAQIALELVMKAKRAPVPDCLPKIFL